MLIPPEAKSFSVSANAVKLAETMHELAQWSKSHPNSKKFDVGVLRLPPFFSVEKNGIRNLVAMIKTLADYEEGFGNGVYPTLAELPERYNVHRGTNELTEKDIRKVHNWLQQVSFGVRAAMVELEFRQIRTASVDGNGVAERVFQKLYANNERRSFVAFSPDNKYELKPLRRATNDAKKRWIQQEIDQRFAGVSEGEQYGARPNILEWEVYGLKGHVKTACAEIRAQFESLSRRAQQLDREGRYEDADALDTTLVQMSKSLDYFERLESVF